MYAPMLHPVPFQLRYNITPILLFGVPYATFKRWKIDGFVTEKQVAVNKGKCILTDPKWAQSIANPRKMFVSHSLAMWVEKHPSKKYDAPAKKVNEPLSQCHTKKKYELN
jgi:hypothetical protein